MRTLGQQRAEYALEKIMKIDVNTKKDLKNFTAGAPSMILQNGFGQSLAFWLAKGTDKDLEIKPNDKNFIIFKIIMDWLAYEAGDVKNMYIKKTDSPKEFIEEISKMSQTQYLNAQKETLALLEWVKRFANADL